MNGGTAKPKPACAPPSILACWRCSRPGRRWAGLLTLAFGLRVIWGSCALLVVSFGLMFREKDA